jgi:hypothetical protein
VYTPRGGTGLTAPAHDISSAPETPPGDGRSVVAALILIALLWAGALIAYLPAASSGVEGPPTEFSSARALTVLRDLVGNSIPHPMGSAANAAVRDRIVARLRQLGYEPELQTGVLVCDSYGTCGSPEDILVRIPGTQNDSGSVLLAAHYDSVAAGPGASDDGTGVAVVLEIARILKAAPPARHPIVLLIDDGEEAGLLGAQAFTEHHRWAKAVRAAVNIDNRGTSGPSLMFETGSANRWLMQLYSRNVAHPHSNSLYYAIYKLLPNDTDFTIFKQAGYQGFNFGYIGDVANYHTPQDDIAHVRAASLQQHGDSALSVLQVLANGDIESPPAGEAVYFDVYGALLLSLPQEVVLPTAIVTMILILLTTTLLLRRREIRMRELAWSLAGLAITYLAAATLAFGLSYFVGYINPDGLPTFCASPWVLEGTCVAAAAAVLCALSLALWKRVGFWSFWSANAVWTGLFALLLSVKLSGASYLALLPAIAGLIPMLVRLSIRRRERMLPHYATLGFLLVSFALLCPILSLLYVGVGRPGLPLLVLLPVFGAAPVVGLLLLSARSVRRLATALAVSIMLLGAAIAARMPIYSAQSPQSLNLHYIKESADGPAVARARWLVSQFSRRLAPQFKQLMPFSRVHGATFNPLLALGHSEFAAEAPLLDLPSPTLMVTSAVATPLGAQQAARVRYQVHVMPNAAVSILRIAFAPQAQVRSATVTLLGPSAFPPVTSPLRIRGKDWRVMSVVNPPAGGLDLSFEAADVPYDIDIVNVSYGLPPAATSLLQARPSDASAIQGGDDTLVATTVHMPKLPPP